MNCKYTCKLIFVLYCMRTLINRERERGEGEREKEREQTNKTNVFEN